MKISQPLLLALVSGLLLFAAWPVVNVTPLIFFAFTPLLWMEEITTSKIKYWLLIYMAMFTWNAATTWWIWNASATGAIMAILSNSLLMCLPWMGFRSVKTKLGNTWGYTSLIFFWLCFEYLHLQDWGLSWPWLTLGNVFANNTDWIQWYEITGVSGGSLWILAANILLYHVLFVPNPLPLFRRWKKLAIVCSILIIPFIISLLIPVNERNYKNQDAGNSIVIIQPNIDPYQKLATGTFEMQLQKLIQLSESKVDSNTSLLIWPETALYSPNGFDETNLTSNFFLNPLFAFLKRYPKLQLITGIESYRVFNEKVSAVAKPIDGTSNFYEVYNGSVLLDSTGATAFYHKSMLVPGVETLPGFLLFLAPVFEKFGGTAGGYAKQDERTPIHTNSQFIIAPAVCYESIYGEYMSHYVAKGSNLITIITNDGWWGNTPGYQQHQLYAKLRAIETRTWVARSANTGISCFIDPSGAVHQPQPWWHEAAIKMRIQPTHQKTVFVKCGDIIGKSSCILSLLLILYLIYKRLRKQS